MKLQLLRPGGPDGTTGRRARWVVPVVIAALGVPAAVGAGPAGLAAGAAQAAAAAEPGGSARTASVPVSAVRARPEAPPAMRDARAGRPPRAAWPAAGSARVSIAATTGKAAPAAALPPVHGLPLGLAASKAGGPAAARVTVADRSVAQRAGVAGVVFSVAAEGGGGAADLAVGYAPFADGHGANFGSRLRLVSLPACALTTPDVPRCQVRTPVAGARNDETAAVVTAPSVALTAQGGVFALAAAADSTSGTFTATSLSPTYSWSAGSQGGSFSWTYPMATPAAIGGPAPDLALSYSSGGIDGLTTNRNTQASWVGRGWELNAGYVERSYKACADDGHATGDLCWSSNDRIATLVFGGRSVKIVKGDDGVWHASDDDGLRIEELRGAPNGAAEGGVHWRVTAADGTQYYYGLTKRYPTDPETTNSTLLVPVFGDDAGEPCHQATYAASWCWLGYRWNLDYVVDPRGNSMTYFWTKHTGKYARNNNQAATNYDIGGRLSRIDYGTRAGTEGAADPAARIELASSGRQVCDPTCRWPDVPWDQSCNLADANCGHVPSPTFFEFNKLDSVTALVWDAELAGLRPVDRWSMAYEYPDAGGGSGPTLYLRTVTHTGFGTDGVGVSEAPVRFEATPLQNRVDSGNGNGVPPLFHWRMSQIKTNTGRRIDIAYAGADCTKAQLDAGQVNPDQNWRRCYPQRLTVGNSTGWGWFHKYLVTSVRDVDLTGGAPSELTEYAYSTEGSSTNVLWGHDEAGMVPIARRTWSQWAGYSTVRTWTGEGADRALVHRRYFRGLDGDRTDAGDGTRGVTASDSQQSGVRDDEALRGRLMEETDYRTATDVASSTLTSWSQTLLGQWNAPWTDGRQRMYVVRPDVTRTRTRLADGSWRWSTTDTDTDADGLTLRVKDLGGDGTADDTCTTTTYARNDTAHLIDAPARVQTRSGAACTSGDVLAESRTYYDGSATLGAAPSKGLATRTQSLVAAPDTWAETQAAHDVHGRVVSATDARGKTTTTAYTPATGGPVRQTRVVNPLGHASTTYVDRRGVSTRVVDANGRTTTTSYDALRRLVKAWQPGRTTDQTPDVEYAYTLRNDAANVVTTKRLAPGGGQVTSYELFDGRLRSRQKQSPAPEAMGGRTVEDTAYDGRGRAVTASTFWNSAAPAATLVSFADADVPRQTRTRYDLLGRVTAEEAWSRNARLHATTTEYGGDRVLTTPPEGGTPTTVLTDVRGNRTELRQHLGATTSAPFRATRYGYDAQNRLTTITDPAGNVRRTTYDAGGRETAVTDPDTGVTNRTFNAAGDLLTSTDARGQRVAFTYDSLGRKTGVWRDATAAPGYILAAWTYDVLPSGAAAKGLLTSTARWHQGRKYVRETAAFDERYRPLAVTVRVPAEEGALAGDWTTTRTYAADGSPATTTYPAAGGLPAETVTHAYDATGLPTRLTGADPYVAETEHYFWGEAHKRILGAAPRRVVLVSGRPDSTRRLTWNQAFTETPSGPWADALWEDYGYDAAGNVRSIQETQGGTAVARQCFGYDRLRRLQEAWTTTAAACQETPNQAAVGGPAAYWTSYRQDDAGNRVTETAHAASGDTTRTYAYPAAGAGQPHTVRTVTATGAAPGTDTFAYDAAGNTTSRRLQGAPEQVLTWDAEGRLTRLAEGAGTTSYLHDADGARLLAVDPDGATLYLDGQEVRRTASGVTATRYYGDVAARTPAGLTWLAGDHQGTSRIAVSASDHSVTRRRLDPFGNPRGTQPAWPTSRGFVGGVSDPSGLTHLGAREYDPRTGRFVSHDPVVTADDPQQLDGYAYAGHSPVTFADPAGTCRGREEGDLCPGHTRGPWAGTPAGDEARKKHFHSPKTPSNVSTQQCRNSGAKINCNLSPKQQEMRDRLEKMRAEYEHTCSYSLSATCLAIGMFSNGNPYEAAWCYYVGLVKCRIANNAYQEADRMAGTIGVGINTPTYGAFRHGYWFALIGFSGGVSAEEAALLGGAHELGAWIAQGEENVQYGGWDSNNDMHNNEVGYGIGRELWQNPQTTPYFSPHTKEDVKREVINRILNPETCPNAMDGCLIPSK